MAMANDEITTTEPVESSAADASGVLTDADVAKVKEVADEQTKALQTSLDDGIKSLDASVNESVGKTVANAIEQSETKSAETTQTVLVDSEQWQGVLDHMQFERDSLSLQNALLLFSLMLMAALIGMRFFSEFSRGFRHG